MNRFDHFFLDNQWVRATGTSDIDVVNPATGQIVGRLRACSPADVHRAVASAQAGLAAAAQFDSGLSRLFLVGALMSWSNWPTESRHKRGYGAEWDKVRKFVLERDGHLCQCKHCKSEGRTTIATEVDHIVSRANA